MSRPVHTNEEGVIFHLTIQDEDGVDLDVSAVDVKTIHFTKPDGTTLSKTAAYTSDGTDGEIQYTSAAGEIDQVGQWSYAGYVEITDGAHYHTEVATFDVVAPLVTVT
jgi:hypothetical protein